MTNPETTLPDGAGVIEPQTDTGTIPATSTAREFTVTVGLNAGEPVSAAFERLATQLAVADAEILSLMVFSALSAKDEITQAMHSALGETQWPITWIEGASCDNTPLAGVQAFALSGQTVHRVRLGDRIVGSVYEDGGARHCLLGGLGPTALTLEAPAQVQQMFGNLEGALDQAGFELSDLMRTWFYNDEILAWYGDFNRVRSAHYAGVKWRTGSLPASTGIGARNADGAALTAAAWAMRPVDGVVLAREVGSPLQCPAPTYGSAFSRAMELESGGWRRLLVSGTASIFPDGKTAWGGNARNQVDLTMEVVGAILESRDMSFGNVTRATAYYRDPALVRHFNEWCAEQELQSMPVVNTHGVICREELLFEIELDACTAAS